MLTELPFFKLSGSGNDFIVIDNRTGTVGAGDISAFVRSVCCRKMSAGADGLILVENSDKADFRWRFFNSDGSRAEMCGNGARCVARFAYVKGIAGPELTFETDVGIVSASVSEKGVKISTPDPGELKLDETVALCGGPRVVSTINTGVPHAVILLEDLDSVQVVEIGREMRFHQKFAPAGTNVDFVAARPDGAVAVRTYERGVEDETLACGTGAIAAALVAAAKLGRSSPITVVTRSGAHLGIYFSEKSGRFTDIFLEGDARIIYRGRLWEDAWNYGDPAAQDAR